LSINRCKEILITTYAFEKTYPTTKHRCDTKNEPFDPAFTLHDYAHLKTQCPMKTIDIDVDGSPI
jgi:hypothetical protein